MSVNIMYKGTFHCYFGDIENYPFELQKCSFTSVWARFSGPRFSTRPSAEGHDAGQEAEMQLCHWLRGGSRRKCAPSLRLSTQTGRGLTPAGPEASEGPEALYPFFEEICIYIYI